MLTSETGRIDDELLRAWDGDCWHGPPLREGLRGVEAATAAAKHPAVTHSIWEMVNHVAAWVEVVRLRIAERSAIAEPEAGDFPPVTDASPAEWDKALARLDEEVRTLRRLARGLDAARLDETVPGKDYPVAVMLHGTAQHFAYHAGQVALLKKLLAR